MSTSAIVGIQWGDEGKGRMVDLIAEEYDVVVRFQGGNNAGHTVVNELGTFKLNLMPSGIFRREKLNILGNGTVVDLEHLCGEMDRVTSTGVSVTPENFMISDRAMICFPYHRDLDCFEEERLAGEKYGSTRRGIAPCYGDKALKKNLQVGELLLPRDLLVKRLTSILEYKNLLIEKVYGKPKYTVEDMLAWLDRFGGRLLPFIQDVGEVLTQADKQGKKILFEGQLGALRDIDFGIYPFTSSSNPLAAYAPVGCGAPNLRLDDAIGVIKAYSTCVGEGPFVVEWEGEQAEKLRAAGGEYGAATGRPRRVGPIDLVASKYGTRVQGANRLALTKMDVISYMEEIPVCVAYRIDGQVTDKFPLTELQYGAEPVYEYLKGWNCDISHIRKYEDLPAETRAYIEYLEEKLECPIAFISVGAEREEIIRR